MEEKTIVIFNPALAKELLKKKYRIIDIKPKRDSQFKESVFVFSVEDGLMEVVNSYKK